MKKILIFSFCILLLCAHPSKAHGEPSFYGIPWGSTVDEAFKILGQTPSENTENGRQISVEFFGKSYPAFLLFNDAGFYSAVIKNEDYPSMKDALADYDLFNNAFIQEHGEATLVMEQKFLDHEFDVTKGWRTNTSILAITGTGVVGKDRSFGALQITWHSLN